MDRVPNPAMSTLGLAKRSWPALLALSLLGVSLVAGCGNSPADRASAIHGRWHMVARSDIGDPLATLAAEYIEFHPNGVLASLLFDPIPQQFWTTRMGEYTLSDRDQITVQGKCWQGWQSYDCSQGYRFELRGDSLAIYDQDGERYLEYERAGTVDSNPPPTLMPPMPSATPVGG